MIAGVCRAGAPGSGRSAGGLPASRPASHATPDLTFDVTLRMWITRQPASTETGLCSFFCAHPVDGITAGSNRGSGVTAAVIPSCIPRLRTAPAACLHRLSTGLCTARLDGAARPNQTVTPA